MRETVTLRPDALRFLRTVDERLMSYNIEMAEVAGGTFWRAYTPGQIAGTEPFPPMKGPADFANAMQVYPPVDLTVPKMRALAAQFGSVWVRVSGTWASKTYYDFDGKAGGKAPAGYQNVLTKEQWLGVLDFVKAVDGKLMISVANCQGLHAADEPWNPSEAEKIFSLSRDYGVPIQAAEFMNEPNMLGYSGAPEGYTPDDYARDQDLFCAWVRAHYPDCLLVGPSNTCDNSMGPAGANATSTNTPAGKGGGGVASLMSNVASVEQLMDPTKEKLDIYSYHYYNGVSERLAGMMPGAHWDVKDALGEPYLGVAGLTARLNVPARDKYCPGSPMWVTESGDAGGGGDTWASTYLDVFRTLNELGEFCTITDGVIFHNTLAASDYAFLDRVTHDPRPNYFAVLLWTRLMGQTVYDTGEAIREGAHVFAHSRKDGKEGVCYLVINNSETEATDLVLPADAVRYTLSADFLRAPVMRLNGRPLALTAEGALPDLSGEVQKAGTLSLAPATITFLVF